LIGVFLAQDLFLFYVFWEICLVPMYFLVGIWGHGRRIYAAVKFFLYTMAGSVLMLTAIIYIYNKTATFSYPAILDMLATSKLTFPPQEQMLLFLAFFVAFAIKVPLFPLHTWLPDAHVEAPTAGSIMLAGVMLKMGTYGILHFCLPLFPSAARMCAPWIVVLAIIGIIYGSLVALVQPNMKKLVAYTSVAHLGFVVLGIFTFTQPGLDGAAYQMLNHGISTGALFLIVGILYERRHSLEIADYGGVATVAPWLSIAFLITTLASIGLPLLNNFVGEFLVLQGAAIANFSWAIWASLGVILSACYMLWLYQRVFYGETSPGVRDHILDLSLREWAAIVPLIAMMVWMGVYSQTFLAPVGNVTALVLKQTTIQVPTWAAVPSNSAAPANSSRDREEFPMARMAAKTDEAASVVQVVNLRRVGNPPAAIGYQAAVRTRVSDGAVALSLASRDQAGTVPQVSNPAARQFAPPSPPSNAAINTPSTEVASVR
jgi:NADH-quinone oxidoreductase subunit M